MQKYAVVLIDPISGEEQVKHLRYDLYNVGEEEDGFENVRFVLLSEEESLLYPEWERKIDEDFKQQLLNRPRLKMDLVEDYETNPITDLLQMLALEFPSSPGWRSRPNLSFDSEKGRLELAVTYDGVWQTFYLEESELHRGPDLISDIKTLLSQPIED